MNWENFAMIKETADEIEGILITKIDDPDQLYKSAQSILEGFRKAFYRNTKFESEKMIMEMKAELKENPNIAILMIYKLLRFIRLAELEEVYEEIVKPRMEEINEMFS